VSVDKTPHVSHLSCLLSLRLQPAPLRLSWHANHPRRSSAAQAWDQRGRTYPPRTQPGEGGEQSALPPGVTPRVLPSSKPTPPRTLRSMRSTSSSLSTATLPCLRIQAANLGSVFSSASAKSFWRHHALWNGQYAYREACEHVHRASALQDEHACEGGRQRQQCTAPCPT